MERSGASEVPRPDDAVVLESFRVEVLVAAGRPEWLDDATLRHLDECDFRASVEAAVREVVARLGLQGAEVRIR